MIHFADICGSIFLEGLEGEGFLEGLVALVDFEGFVFMGFLSVRFSFCARKGREV